MPRHVAFLRGMNLGGRRITNDELCAHFRALGLENVAAFLASGNVVFDAPADGADLGKRIERGLRDALEYTVPTFLRSADEVREIAAREPFREEELAASGGKVQVAMLRAGPAEADRGAVLALATADDRLALAGRELYWLPSRGVSGTELDLAAVEKRLGVMTVRTQRTVRRLAAKFLAG